MNHTPGPWKCDEMHHFATHTESSSANRVYTEIECKCNPKHKLAVRYIPYNEDDANLIAAAPDLLEALKLSQQLVKNMLWNCDAKTGMIEATHVNISKWEDVYNKISQAIAKAEGK